MHEDLEAKRVPSSELLLAIVFTCVVAEHRPGEGHSAYDDGREASMWLGIILVATLVVSYGVSLVSALKRSVNESSHHKPA